VAWVAQSLILAHAIGTLIIDTLPKVSIYAEVAFFIALAVLRAGLDIYAGAIAATASERLQQSIRERLLRAVAASSPLDAKRPHSGETAAVVSQFVDALGPYLLRYQPARLRVIVTPLAILAAVAYVSWLAALILVIAAPVIPIFMALIGNRARAASLRHLRQLGSLNGYLLDRLQNLLTIRLFNAVEHTAHGLSDIADKVRGDTMRVLRIAFLSSAVLEFFAALGVASIAIYVGFSLLGFISVGAYDTPLTLSSGLFVLLLAPEFFQPFRDFAIAYHDRAAALAGAHEILRVLDPAALRIPGDDLDTSPYERDRRAPEIDLTRIDMQLEPLRVPVLRAVSLTIRPGEHVAIVGPSGCGKTLLLGLIAGLVSPTSGRIAIDGAELTEANAGQWRRRVAWLSQKPTFVHATIKQNLLLGRDGCNNSALKAAMADVALQDVVDRLPRGLESKIGEQGFGLSGGEAQRLALARAIAADCDVIVADEPTEHLDADTADIVIAALLRHARERTLIVATHDQKLMRCMHRIIDIDQLKLHRRTSSLEAAE
jgi:ATP-binding cassette subfamily C protein CydD